MSQSHLLHTNRSNHRYSLFIDGNSASTVRKSSLKKRRPRLKTNKVRFVKVELLLAPADSCCGWILLADESCWPGRAANESWCCCSLPEKESWCWVVRPIKESCCCTGRPKEDSCWGGCCCAGLPEKESWCCPTLLDESCCGRSLLVEGSCCWKSMRNFSSVTLIFAPNAGSPFNKRIYLRH